MQSHGAVYSDCLLYQDPIILIPHASCLQDDSSEGQSQCGIICVAAPKMAALHLVPSPAP